MTNKTQSVCKHCHANIEWTGHGKVYIDSDLSPFCGNSKVGHEPDPDALVYEPVAEPTSTGEATLTWTEETMQIINKLTPNIKGKAFDIEWFLLRQRLEEMEWQAKNPAARPSEPSAPQTSTESICGDCGLSFSDGFHRNEDTGSNQRQGTHHQFKAAPQASPKEVVEQSAEPTVEGTKDAVADQYGFGTTPERAPRPVAGEGPLFSLNNVGGIAMRIRNHPDVPVNVRVNIVEQVLEIIGYKPEGTPKLEEILEQIDDYYSAVLSREAEGQFYSAQERKQQVKVLLRSFIPASTPPNEKQVDGWIEKLTEGLSSVAASLVGARLWTLSQEMWSDVSTPASTGEANGILTDTIASIKPEAREAITLELIAKLKTWIGRVGHEDYYKAQAKLLKFESRAEAAETSLQQARVRLQEWLDLSTEVVGVGPLGVMSVKRALENTSKFLAALSTSAKEGK